MKFALIMFSIINKKARNQENENVLTNLLTPNFVLHKMKDFD